MIEIVSRSTIEREIELALAVEASLHDELAGAKRLLWGFSVGASDDPPLSNLDHLDGARAFVLSQSVGTLSLRFEFEVVHEGEVETPAAARGHYSIGVAPTMSMTHWLDADSRTMAIRESLVAVVEQILLRRQVKP